MSRLDLPDKRNKIGYFVALNTRKKKSMKHLILSNSIHSVQ